ncbi:MAG: hypothetical protein LBT14_09275 [Treponema sp.]|jgi:vacuolar-type H+-ATPase subunit H|nr:hypothetical protein [Treponema sp.]
MDEQNVLQHLLQVEAEAAGLVHDAQAEADRRLAEGEQQNRLHYEEQYGQEVAELDQEYEKVIAAVKADYARQLEAYRESLDTMVIHQGRFGELVDRLLINREP